MIQTMALFVAAYRELNARKLFWLSLGLSVVVVGIFGMFGIDQTGISVWPFGWSFDSPFFNSNVISPESFYKLMFMNLGVKAWLGLFATALALISTAGIIPDLVSAGSIDMMLAKPLSRARLFLTKYLTGLLFTALQVTVFALASFLVIGLRGRVWEPSLFLAVPYVVVIYSYLYCVCALVGLLTRSTIAALIVTAIFWLLLLGVHSSESLINYGTIASSLEVSAIEAELAKAQADADEDPETVAELTEELASQRSSDATWHSVHWWVFAAKTVLPKAIESLNMLERQLVVDARLRGGLGADAEARDETGGEIFGHGRVERAKFIEALRADENSRGVWWVLVTSLVFEGVVLSIATVLFCRRDF